MCNSAERAKERDQDDLPAICQAEESKAERRVLMRLFHGRKQTSFSRQASRFERLEGG